MVHRLPSFVNIKQLAKVVRKTDKQVGSKLSFRHKKALYSNFDGIWYKFNDLKEMIIPLSVAAQHIRASGKGSVEREDPHEIIATHHKALIDAGVSSRPVILLLGHFNHGKTTLLDALSSTMLVNAEPGGITQEIRTVLCRLPRLQDHLTTPRKFSDLIARTYSDKIAVKSCSGSQVQMPDVYSVSDDYLSMTLVDTPGQDIFFRMRNYGASVADLVILLVAADEEVCSQTEESIGIIQSLGLPCIVCINKIDKIPASQLVSRLTSLEKKLREYENFDNPNTLFVPISAKLKVNFHHLAAAIQDVVLQKKLSESDCVKSELAFSKQDKMGPNDLCTGYGIVLNVWMSRQEGKILHVVVRSGDVQIGDVFSCGGWMGTVKSMRTLFPPITNLFEMNTLPPPDPPMTMGQVPPGVSGSSSSVDDESSTNEQVQHPHSEMNLSSHMPEVKEAKVEAGTGVFLCIKPETASDPRPLGEEIFFSRGKEGKNLCEKLTEQREMMQRLPEHVVICDRTILQLNRLRDRLDKKTSNFDQDYFEDTTKYEDDLINQDIVVTEMLERDSVVLKCHSDIVVGDIIYCKRVITKNYLQEFSSNI